MLHDWRFTQQTLTDRLNLIRPYRFVRREALAPFAYQTLPDALLVQLYEPLCARPEGRGK